MTKTSLKELTDDILLMIRNNNISESEDFSRAQIYSWVKQYKHNIFKQEKDKIRQQILAGRLLWDQAADNTILENVETGPLELEVVESKSDQPIFTKRTVEPIGNVFDNSENSILSVHDQQGEVIQYMDHVRKHYHQYRKYTFGEFTAQYMDDGHIYIHGLPEDNELKYIYVLWIKDLDDSSEEDDDTTDDDIQIPTWMVPIIKDNIVKNELSFMLQRPSDDNNNSTVASVKPAGPQDNEK